MIVNAERSNVQAPTLPVVIPKLTRCGASAGLPALQLGIVL